MAELFSSLDRRAKLILELDGKDYRREVSLRSDEIFTQLRHLLATNYKSTVVGPNYTVYLKGLADEFARFFINLDLLMQDYDFDTTRPEFLYQIVGSLLAVDEQISINTFSDEEFRRFLLSLIQLYFGGSTPANIIKGIELFTNTPVSLQENFLLARNPASSLDISDQFGFQVQFTIDDTLPQSFAVTEERILALLKLIKPAHTLFELSFIFSEDINIHQEGGIHITDTLLAFDVFEYFYEDFRTFCDGREGQERLGKKTEQIVDSESINTIALPTGSRLVTRYGPLVELGSYGEILATATDVQIVVSGVTHAAVFVDPLQGIIDFAGIYSSPTTASVDYTWFPRPKYTALLDSSGYNLDAFQNDYLTKYPYDIVLDGYIYQQPQENTYSYRAFEREYSALLDDKFSLLLDQNVFHIRNEDSSISNPKFVLDKFESLISGTSPATVLNEGTPLFPLRQVGTSGIPGNASTGSLYNWYEDFSSSKITVGEVGLLSVACDDWVAIELNYATGAPEYIVPIAADINTLYTFSYNFETGLNNPEFVLFSPGDYSRVMQFDVVFGQAQPGSPTASPTAVADFTESLSINEGSTAYFTLVRNQGLWPTANIFFTSDYSLTAGTFGMTGSYLYPSIIGNDPNIMLGNTAISACPTSTNTWNLFETGWVSTTDPSQALILSFP